MRQCCARCHQWLVEALESLRDWQIIPRGKAGLSISFTSLTPEAVAKQAVEKRVRAIA